MTTVTPMTIKQAAEHVGLSIWSVYEITERGELPSAMLSGRRFVARENLDEYVTALGRAL
jgi:excisionase family DNA binding protein